MRGFVRGNAARPAMSVAETPKQKPHIRRCCLVMDGSWLGHHLGRTLIISRTNDGRVAAKARGVAFGRPKKMRPDQQQLARELVRDGKSISAVARTFNVHTATIYRIIEG
jgi:hypothetical protein